MPKTGMKPIRQRAIVDAAISEIGRAGSLEVTVSEIARQAGVSSALAHHYMGSKDQIFLAAMRQILSVFSAEVRGALAMAETPRQRVEAIIRASFSERNFRPETVSAWLNFYVEAHRSEPFARLLRVYHRRLHSNLTYNLRELAPRSAHEIAQGVSAMIDGLYIQYAFKGEQSDEAAVDQVLTYLDSMLSCRGKSN